MATKEQFLNKLASKMGRERVTQVNKPKWIRHPWDHLHQGLDQAGLVAGFAEMLQGLGGEVIRVASEAEVGPAIKQLLEAKGIDNLIAWPAPPDWSPHAPSDYLARENIRVSHWSEAGPREQLIDTAEQAGAGMVYASHGLCETGSVVLYNRGDRGRLVSLLPNQFIAILRGSTVIPRITQLLAQAGSKALEHSCINIITGPSRSADIEMDLSIGVHGPGRIAVILIEDY